MTLREIDIKIKSLYQQLDVIRIYEREMLLQVGKRRYEQLLDDTLDQITYYQEKRKKVLNP